MIDNYETGRLIRINGETFRQDVKIIGDVVKGNWWRRQGHRLDAADIEDILDFRPEVLVIGTGYAGQMKVPSATRTVLEDAKIRIEADETGRAVHVFNRLHKAGRKLAGAFHLTC
jgi:hypothetical protein